MELWDAEFTHFEIVRQEIFTLITGKDVTQETAKKLMLMAYLEFSACSENMMDKDGNFNKNAKQVRARWPDLVNETAKKHNVYIQ